MVIFHTANRRIQKLILTTALAVSATGFANAQSNDTALAQYSDLLAKRHALTVKIAKMELDIRTQEQKIQSLKDQTGSVDETIASVPGLVERMVKSYAAEFELDPPFNAAERYERLAKLQEQIETKSSTPASMLRRAIGMYEAEVNYGMTVEQYPGNHPLEAREGWRAEACKEDLLGEACSLTGKMLETIREKTGKDARTLDMVNPRDAEDVKELYDQFVEERKMLDGNYLRVGRLALVYADVDGGEVLVYDIKGKRDSGGAEANVRVSEWVPVEGADQINLFRAVKMAKGEAAVDVMKIPVIVD